MMVAKKPAQQSKNDAVKKESAKKKRRTLKPQSGKKAAHWQKTQQSGKQKKVVRKIVLLLIIFIGACLIFLSAKSAISWMRPLPHSDANGALLKWNGKDYQNFLVIVTDHIEAPKALYQIATVTADPFDNSLNVAFFEDNQAQQNNITLNWQAEIDRITQELNIYIDGYLLVEKDTAQSLMPLLSLPKGENNQEEIIKQTVLKSKNPLFVWDFFKLKEALSQGSFTNLSTQTLLRLLYYAKNVREDHLSVSYIQTDLYVLTNPLPDYWFQDAAIKSERVKLAILNGTPESGIAQSVAKKLTALGAEVIIIDNTKTPQEQTQLLAIEIENTATRKKLEKLFKVGTSKNPESEDRADMTIILGEDFLK